MVFSSDSHFQADTFSLLQGYLCLGNALTGLKLESEAVLAFGRCLALNPTVSTAKKALAQVLLTIAD